MATKKRISRGKQTEFSDRAADLNWLEEELDRLVAEVVAYANQQPNF